MAGQIPAQTKTAQGNTVKIMVFENDPTRVIIRGWYNGRKYVSTTVDRDVGVALMLADSKGAVELIRDGYRVAIYEVKPPYSLLVLKTMGAPVSCEELATISDVECGGGNVVIKVDGGITLFREMASTYSVLALKGLVESVLQKVYGPGYKITEITDVALTGYGIYRVNSELYMLGPLPEVADYKLEDIMDVVGKVYETGEVPFDALNRMAARMVFNAYAERGEDGDPASWLIVKLAIKLGAVNEGVNGRGVSKIRIGGAWYRLEWSNTTGVYRYTWEPPADADGE